MKFSTPATALRHFILNQSFLLQSTGNRRKSSSTLFFIVRKLNWVAYREKKQKLQMAGAQWLIEANIKNLDLPKTSTVLDLGCGNGNVTRNLLQPVLPKDATILGIDSDLASIQEAEKKHQLPQVSFQHMDIRCLENFDKNFDLIVSFNAFHWIPDHRSLWKNIGNLLKANGKVSTIFQGKNALFESYKRFMKSQKYGKYLQDAEENFIPVTQHMEDINMEYQKILDASAPELNLKVVAKEVQVPMTKMELKGSIAAVCPFLCRMDSRTAEEFLDDLLEDVMADFREAEDGKMDTVHTLAVVTTKK